MRADAQGRTPRISCARPAGAAGTPHEKAWLAGRGRASRGRPPRGRERTDFELDAIRPGMMADATRSARSVAEQFAKDSGTDLGAIQNANQGIFEIMSRDTSTLSADWNSTQNSLGSIDKKVRLVTTVVYRLK